MIQPLLTIYPIQAILQGSRLSFVEIPTEVQKLIDTLRLKAENPTGLPASFSKKIPGHFQDISIFWSVFQGPFIIFQGSSKW